MILEGLECNSEICPSYVSVAFQTGAERHAVRGLDTNLDKDSSGSHILGAICTGLWSTVSVREAGPDPGISPTQLHANRAIYYTPVMEYLRSTRHVLERK